MNFRNSFLFAVISVTFLVSGCGGGGDSGRSQGPPPTLNLNAAWEAYTTQDSSRTYKISGSLNNVEVNGSGTFTAEHAESQSVVAYHPDNPFWGRVDLTNMHRISQTYVSNIVINGSTTVEVSSVQLYSDQSNILKIIKDVDADEQSQVTFFSGLPTAVTSGSFGDFYSATIYSRLGYTCGTETVTYSVKDESESALLVTFAKSKNTTRQAQGECTTSSESQLDVYRLTSSGISYVTSTGSISDVSGSVVLTFQ